MSQEFILFCTTGGAEIVGRVTSWNLESNTVTVEQPLVIRPIQRPDSSYALDLFPHSLVDSEGQHKFFINNMMSIAEKVPAELEKAYIERTSKLILAGQLDRLERLV